MAMEDEGQAKEIPLATAQPVHAHLGSWLVESAVTLERYVQIPQRSQLETPSFVC